jgi:hypothetical protein
MDADAMLLRMTHAVNAFAHHTDALLALTQDKNERYRRLQRLSDDRALLLGRLGRVTSDTTTTTNDEAP